MDKSTIALLFAGLFALSFALSKYQTAQKLAKRENYQDTFVATDYSKDNWVSRPNFQADLSPRFDAERVGGGQITGQFPGMSVQGAGVTPVESLVDVSSNPNYASMGGGAYSDPRLSGGLSTNQVNEILSQKFGRNAQDYVEPKSLLPVPDMKKALAKDPSDPGTFMYDRYLFAPLKRRYGNVEVDFIRGDIPIEQYRTGWFDARPVAQQDLSSGYFSNFLDIQQSTILKDTMFNRVPNQVDQQVPWGRLSEKTVYSVL
jgi:hypothetical protein